MSRASLPAQGIAGSDHQIAVVERQAGGITAGDREFVTLRRLDLEPVAEAGEDGKAVDEVVTVVAPSGNMQRQVDLGRRKPRPDLCAGLKNVGCWRDGISPWPDGIRRSSDP
jgi:hypothetical protein